MKRISLCFVSLFLIMVCNVGLAQENFTIAVLDFEGFGISVSETQALTNRTRTLIFRSGKYQIVERGKMDEILKEQGFQQTGCTTEECIVQVGQLLGVKFMLAGSIGLVGSTYTIDMRIIDVETSKIYKSASQDVYGKIDDVLATGLGEVLNILLEEPKVEKVAPAQVLIISEPAGAMVLINGERKGITPLRLDDIPPNQAMELQVLLQNYQPFVQTVTLEPGVNPSLAVTLTILKGHINIVGGPESSVVKLDKTIIGKTPIRDFEYPVGDYQLTISKPEFITFQETVSLSNGQPVTVDYQTQPIPKSKPLLLSVVLPGSGQLVQHRKIRGLIFLAATVGMGYLANNAQSIYKDDLADWENKRDIYNNNVTQPELWQTQKQAVVDAYDILKDSESKRNLILGGLGLVWTINIIDIIF
jgi:hypothetical protein